MTDFERPVLVTGAAGCIGAWVVATLVRGGHPIVAFDLSAKRDRLALLLEKTIAAAVPWHCGDIADPDALKQAIMEHDIGTIIHLAALQVPFCKADPLAGARANVVGHVNVLEAARLFDIRRIVYTSSIAAQPIGNETHPSTLYGAYKAADEAIAQIYWCDWSVPSIGLRPHTVYGLGRDQGLTSAPTKAILASAARQDYTIPFRGHLQFQYAADVAEIILSCAAQPMEGAPVFDMGGASVSVDDIVAAIKDVEPSAHVATAGEPLPFPYDRDSGPLKRFLGSLPETPLHDGIAATMSAFRDLLANGRITPQAA